MNDPWTWIWVALAADVGLMALCAVVLVSRERWRASSLAWESVAKRVPRVPIQARTIVAPEFHAPRVDFPSRVARGGRS